MGRQGSAELLAETAFMVRGNYSVGEISLWGTGAGLARVTEAANRGSAARITSLRKGSSAPPAFGKFAPLKWLKEPV